MSEGEYVILSVFGLELMISSVQLSALRGEWLRARARPLRYQEEIVHIREEHRRVAVTLEKNALTWESRSSARDIDCPLLKEGLVAYMAEQAAVQRSFGAHFQRLWQSSMLSPQLEVELVDEGREVEGDGTGGAVLYAFADNNSDEEYGPKRSQDVDDE